MDPVFTQQFNMPPHKAPGGMFGGGKFGIGQAIVAALNGYLAGTGNPVGMQNIRMMQEMAQAKRQRQQELDDYSRKRADDNADFYSHYNYEVQNPKPQQPDDITRHMIGAGIDPNSPQGKAMYAASLDPVVMTPQGPMLRSQLLGASAAGQPAPQGVTFTPIDDGGPTPPASGGFPGY